MSPLPERRKPAKATTKKAATSKKAAQEIQEQVPPAVELDEPEPQPEQGRKRGKREKR